MDEKVLETFAKNFAAVIREIVRDEVAPLISAKEKPQPLLLDIRGAAVLLSAPESWIATAARQGKIPVVRLGHHVRFRVADLQQFIEACRTQNCGAASAAKARRGGQKLSAAEKAAGAAPLSADGVEQ